MVSHLGESKLLTDDQDLRRELEAIQQELLRTQARLHQLQEGAIVQEGAIAAPAAGAETQMEAVLEQLRGQYLQVRYELWVMKACVAWERGDLVRMGLCLEASMDCAVLEPPQLVADWLRRLDGFAREVASSALGARLGEPGLELEPLLNGVEWRSLMQRVVANQVSDSSEGCGLT